MNVEPVKTMGERVAWLVQHLTAGNQREPARRAQLNDERNVGAHLARAREKPDAQLSAETIKSFVEHPNVNMDWLVNGAGQPFGHGTYGLAPRPLDFIESEAKRLGVQDAPTREVETVDRYPSRAPILAAARRRGFDSEAIDVAASIRLEAEGDPGPDHWLSELKAWSRKPREPDLGEEGPAEEAEERALAAAAAARAAPPVKRR